MKRLIVAILTLISINLYSQEDTSYIQHRSVSPQGAGIALEGIDSTRDFILTEPMITLTPEPVPVLNSDSTFISDPPLSLGIQRDDKTYSLKMVTDSIDGLVHLEFTNNNWMTKDTIMDAFDVSDAMGLPIIRLQLKYFQSQQEALDFAIFLNSFPQCLIWNIYTFAKYDKLRKYRDNHPIPDDSPGIIEDTKAENKLTDLTEMILY